MSVFDQHKSSAKSASLTLKTAVAAQDFATALRIYQKNPSSELSPDWIYPLAKQAVEENQATLALELVHGFAQRYPQHADVVKNYLLVVDILENAFSEHEKAAALLAQLCEHYSDHADFALIAVRKRIFDEEKV